MSGSSDNIEVNETVQTDVEFQSSSDKENDNPADNNVGQDKPHRKDISLLQLVCNNKQKTKYICQNWIKLYASFPETALLQFMQFVLEASGSQYQIPEGQRLPFQFSNILIAATAKFGNKSLLYPLVMQAGNTFARNIANFVQQLFRLLFNTSFLVDDILLKNIAGFLQICADSKVRAFRHTSTLIALKMMSGLSATVTLENEKLRQLWLQLFASIFLERADDVVDEIRFLCRFECGLWLRKYPQCYMQPAQVQHLFLALQDNARKVIECCLQALYKVFGNLELRSICLEQAVEHRTTLLGLTMSAESELSQKAIQLLTLYYRVQPQLLDESMLQVIEQLIFAAHRGVAQAAAELVPFRCQDVATDEERVLILVRFFLRVGEHEHAAYLVDAFYGRNEVVLAWSSMVALLLQPPEELLSVLEIAALIEILTRAVKQAVTGEIPPGRYTEDLLREPLANASQLASRVLLPSLSTLLLQYRSCDRDLANLLELPQYMDFEQAPYETLLEQIQDIMFEQQQLDVLQVGARTLEHLYNLNEGHGKHRKQLLNNAVTNYLIATNAWEQSLLGESKMPAKDIAERLLVTLRLLSTLCARFDLHEFQLDDNMLARLKRVVEERRSPVERRLPEELISLYLTIVYVLLSWDLRRLKQATKEEQDVADECCALRCRVDSFLLLNFQLIEEATDLNDGCEAFIYTCDIFVLFADPLRQHSSSSIQALEYRSKISDYELLESFVLRFVFAELLPQDFSVLQSRRRILASYCKLVFHNVLPVMRACIVFQFYERHNSHFGDIMRATMERCLLMNPANFGMTVMHTCLLVYKDIRLTFKDALQAAASSQFADLLKLANLLAELFNVHQLKVRSGILILHRAGIRYAAEQMSLDATVAPANILYLRVIQEFVPQLLAQDMLDVIKSLQLISHVPLPSSRQDEWQPLIDYRKALEIALVQSCRRDDLYNLPNYVEQ